MANFGNFMKKKLAGKFDAPGEKVTRSVLASMSPGPAETLKACRKRGRTCAQNNQTLVSDPNLSRKEVTAPQHQKVKILGGVNE